MRPQVPRWPSSSARHDPRADDERTIGFDEDWEDTPTAQLETVEDTTLDFEPPPQVLRAAPAAPRLRTEDIAAPAVIERQDRPAPSSLPSTAIPAPETPPSAPAEVTTGTMLCGRYVLGRLLGAGGSSQIFEAENRERAGAKNLDTRLAVKVLREDKRDNPHALTRLKREFRQMQRLDHPGIARVFELACDNGVWFMTMELVEGCTINQWLKTKPSRNEALKVIGACSEALIHAHEQGVIHGDLKPSNVIVLPDGGVKLVDFGSAAERDAVTGEIDQERSFAATPPYASPQVLAGEIADPRDDVFSLACLTYAVLTHGEHPFARKSSLEAQQQQLRPAYAREIHPREFDVIVQGLAWAREDRPATVREFLHALLASDLRSATREPTSTTVDISRPVPAPATKPPAAEVTSSLPPATPVLEPSDQPRETTHPITAEPVRREIKNSIEPTNASVEAFARSKAYVRDLIASLRARRPQAATETTQPLASTEKRESWKERTILAAMLVGATALIAYRLGTNQAVETSRADVPAPVAEQPPPESAMTADASPSPAPPTPSTTEAATEAKSPPVAPKPSAPVSAPGEVSFTTRTLRVGPNQTMAALTLQRLKSTRGRARVSWTIEGGTARPGVDYKLSDSRVVEFLDGQSVRSLFIPLIPQENSERSRLSKTFTVKLQQVNGGPALGEIKQVHVTIVGYAGDSAAQPLVTNNATP